MEVDRPTQTSFRRWMRQRRARRGGKCETLGAVVIGVVSHFRFRNQSQTFGVLLKRAISVARSSESRVAAELQESSAGVGSQTQRLPVAE